MRAGFSFVEVVLAIVILALAAVPLVGLFSETSQQTRQGKDYGQLVALEEKVSEEVRQSAWEDPHFHTRFDDASYSMEVPIVDGQSPFFPPLEDAALPLGVITSADPGISKDYTPALHLAVQSFRLEAVPRRRPVGAGEVLDIDLSYRWQDFRDEQMTARVRVTTPLFAARVPEEDEEVPRDVSDERIRALMFPNSSSDLAGLTGPAGALDDLRVLGDAAVAMNRFVQQRVAIKKKALELTGKLETLPPGRERLRIRMAAGRAFESLVAATLDCIGNLREPLDRVRKRPVESLQKLPNSAREAGAQALRETMSIPLTMRVATANALLCYAESYDGPDAAMLTPRQSNRLFVKLLDLAKLEFLVSSSSAALLRVQKMLAAAERQHDGRNRALAHFVRAEMAICQSEARLKAGFSLGRRAADWDAFTALAGPISLTAVRLR